MMAAEQTGRVAYLMELEPRYCDVMARRYAKMVNSEKDIFILRNGERIAYSDV
jgi:DNA modification methylase